MSTLPKIKCKKIAITGSIGSGKSAVSLYLRDLGYCVLSADDIVSSLYEMDTNLKFELQQLTNQELILDNKINKKVMSHLLFTNIEFKQKAEQLIHKRVYEEIFSRIEKCQRPIVFVEIPLLFETQMEEYFDQIIVVDIDDQIRLQRLMKYRKLSLEVINERLKFQMDSKLKREKADIVFDNNGSLEELFLQVDNYLKGIQNAITYAEV